MDEVKEIRDKGEAMRAYARMANDVQLELDAAELRLRAERRLGEMILAAKDARQVSRGQPPKNSANAVEFSRIRLTHAGIDHKLSARAQKIASLPESTFEAAVDSRARAHCIPRREGIP